MLEKEITLLFVEAISQRAIYNKLEGISEDKIYNWRKGRFGSPTIGDKLDVLYQLGIISISKV